MTNKMKQLKLAGTVYKVLDDEAMRKEDPTGTGVLTMNTDKFVVDADGKLKAVELTDGTNTKTMTRVLKSVSNLQDGEGTESAQQLDEAVTSYNNTYSSTWDLVNNNVPTIDGVLTKSAGDKKVNVLKPGALGVSSFQRNGKSLAHGKRSSTDGSSTIALGEGSHAEGNASIAKGDYSHAEGGQALAVGNRSHAEGSASFAGGANSHAEGNMTKATADSAHAEGAQTVAEGGASHAEGQNTLAQALHAHAEGEATQALGSNSHAEGLTTVASGNNSHAEGQYTDTNGMYNSHCEGFATKAGAVNQTAVGSYNDYVNDNTALFVVGNGASESTRSTAFRVYGDGTASVGAMGTTDLSVATKQYVDNHVVAPAWGDITGTLSNQTDLNNELTNIRAVAEGKCKTFVINQVTATWSTIKNKISSWGCTVHLLNGTDITQAVLNGEYDYENFNDAFNTNDDEVWFPKYITESSLMNEITEDIIIIDIGYGSTEAKVGDIILISDLNIPDRWLGTNKEVAQKLETSKIDLTNYATKAEVNAKSTVVASTATVTGATEIHSLKIDNTDYNLPTGGGGGTTDFNALTNRPKYKGAEMTSTTDIPEVTQGPTSATDNAVARFDGVTGKVLQNSSVTIDDNGNVNASEFYVKTSGGDYVNGLSYDNGTYSILVGEKDLLSNLYLKGNSIYASASIEPYMTGSYDLGTSAQKWKDLYLSGEAKVGAISAPNSLSLTTNDGVINTNSRIQPTSNGSIDLGNASYKWQDLYLGRNLTDGTNSIDIAGIVAKSIVSASDTAVSGATEAKSININGTNWNLPTGGGGTGDVTGPASSTDNAIARFDSTTGKVIQNSTVTVDDSGNVNANSIKLNNGSGSYYDGIACNSSNEIVVGNTTYFTGLDLYSSGGIKVRNSLLPYATATSMKDLGSSTYKWNNLYLAGNLTDGTNSIAVEKIGNVKGPTTSIANKIARFDGTDGKSIKNSDITIDDSGKLYGSKGATTLSKIVDRTVSSKHNPMSVYICHQDTLGMGTEEIVPGTGSTATDAVDYNTLNYTATICADDSTSCLMEIHGYIKHNFGCNYVMKVYYKSLFAALGLTLSSYTITQVRNYVTLTSGIIEKQRGSWYSCPVCVADGATWEGKASTYSSNPYFIISNDAEGNVVEGYTFVLRMKVPTSVVFGS